MFTGLVIGSILRPAVLPSHGVQILPAQTALNKADDVSQHDRTRCLIEWLSERILVSGWLHWLRKMVSSDWPPRFMPCGPACFSADALRALHVLASAGRLALFQRD